MSRLAFVASNWKINALIITLFFGTAMFMGQYQEPLNDRAVNADQTVWLPGGSESREVIDRLEESVGGEDEQVAIVVFGTEDGSEFSEEQLAALELEVQAIEAAAAKSDNYKDARVVISPFSEGAQARGQIGADNSTMSVLIPVTASTEPEVRAPVHALRDELEDGVPEGVEVYVTGSAGLLVDTVEVFGSLDVTLLLGTVTLVLVLLLVIYRSPLIALLPLIAVALSYTAAAGLVYLFDMPVNQQTTSILIILMFGAGTDYCLLLVARYREELRKFEQPRVAMREALTHTSPAILSSGLTVIAAMLVLLIAETDSTRTMGPVLAFGIGFTMLGGMLLLPSMLVLMGRWCFWPMIPRAGSAASEKFAFWRAIGRTVDRRPVVTLLVPVVVLLVLSLGNFISMPLLGFGSTDTLRKTTESADGFELLGRGVPKGELAPNVIYIEGESADDVDAAVDAINERLANSESVVRVAEDRSNKDGTIVTMKAVMAGDPYADDTAETVPEIRRELDAVATSTGTEVLFGGPTAQSHDTNVAAQRDDALIIPLVLLVIFLILVAMLRALVAPLHLIASVVLSFAASLGLSMFLFDRVFDQAGTSAGFATFVFIFVVALGVDYNIFLISRVREESVKRGTREGTLEALASTGGIITSAGIILAGTFMVLASMPLLFLFQIGVAVALGVLLDTFVVRGFIVPSMLILLGDRNWWPNAAKYRREDTHAPVVDAEPSDREPALTQ